MAYRPVTLKQCLAVLARRDEAYLSKRANTHRTCDPLDLAYFSFGVFSVLDEKNKAPPEGGQDQFVTECIRYAPLLDLPIPDDNSVMWLYEISEPFGDFVATYIRDNDHGDIDVFKEKLAEWITDACTIGPVQS